MRFLSIFILFFVLVTPVLAEETMSVEKAVSLLKEKNVAASFSNKETMFKITYADGNKVTTIKTPWHPIMGGTNSRYILILDKNYKIYIHFGDYTIEVLD